MRRTPVAERTLITKEQLDALAAKLDTLDLDDDERLVLHAVFAASAPEEEVAGFSLNAYHQGQTPPLSQGFMNVFTPGGKVGFPGGDNAIIIDPVVHI